MSAYAFALAPFADYGFMRRALAACIALSVSGAPLGVFLTMRRMTLMGDALSHAVLPGVAVGFLWGGLALAPMLVGGVAAGLLAAAAGAWIARATPLKEDASFTGMYLIALACGVALLSAQGSHIDLLHVLFGNVLAVDDSTLILLTGVASASVLALAWIYRGLVAECVDPGFLHAAGGRGVWFYQIFLVLVVLNLSAAFQALGTLMALGLMLLPAIAARLWTQSLERMLALAIAFACVSAMAGLLLSYHADIPSGPAIVLCAGALYLFSVLRRLKFLALAAMIISAPAQAAPLHVVASFSILGDMVQNIGGGYITLTVLAGPESDVHEFSPSPQAARALAQADVVIVNGLGLEGWLDRLVAASGYHGAVAVASRGVTPLPNDPHAWQDVQNGVLYAENIRNALSATDPAHAADYARNAARYAQALRSLDAWVRQQISAVPLPKRRVITTHDAFGYFSRAYGVQFFAPQGLSTDAEPSAAALARLADQIKHEHITALFIETQGDGRLMAQLARETGATLGGELYSDTLSAPGGGADSYIGMFRHNVPLLAAAMSKNPSSK